LKAPDAGVIQKMKLLNFIKSFTKTKDPGACMNLQDFISESLSQIINGILDAQKKELPFNAEISPYIHVNNVKTDEKRMKPYYSWQSVTPIKFDIAVTAEQATGTKGGIGVVAGVIALGSQGRTDKLDSSVSRIQFEVPVIMPHWKKDEDKNKP